MVKREFQLEVDDMSLALTTSNEPGAVQSKTLLV